MPYSEEAFDTAVRENKLASFYSMDLKDVIRHVELLKLKFSRNFGTNPNVISGIVVFPTPPPETEEQHASAKKRPRKKAPVEIKPKKKKDTFMIKIRGITPEHPRLQ